MSALHRERWFPVWLVLPGSATLMLLWLLPLVVLVQLLGGQAAGSLGRAWQMMVMLVQNPGVQQELLFNALRLTGTIALEALLGLLLARLLPLRGWAAGAWHTLLGVMLFSPLVISVMGWGGLFQPGLGLDFPPSCQVDLLCENAARLTDAVQVLVRGLWQWVPLFALLCVARLRRIPRVCYQTVAFDGGGRWTAFRLMEWPWLRGALGLGVLFRLMAGPVLDVNFFRFLARADGGPLALLAGSPEWLAGVAGSVPGVAPLSWLLPGLLNAGGQTGNVPVYELTASLTLLQALLMLPALLMIPWLLLHRPSNRQLPGCLVEVPAEEPLGRRRGLLGGLLRWLVLAACAVAGVAPLVWLAVMALQVMTPEGTGYGLAHFMAVLDDSVWRSSLLRTGVRALLTAAVAVLLAVPMAYAWSRRLLAGDRLMTVLLLFSLFMPTVVLALPLIHVNELLGWLGMPYAVGVAHLAFAVPLSVWLLAAGMVRVPVALDEMAMQDGFGFLRFLWQVLLPAVRPHLRGALLVCFMLGWMEFLYARVLGSVVWPPSVVLLSESVMALPLAEGAVHRAEWQVLAAAAWLVMLPVMLAVCALREQLPDMLSLFRLVGPRPRGRAKQGA
ncbi:carbohydrate ABC transporter permease [Lautropia dentalis]|uniref:Carbohydrate ABC transporter permease n=1 Tax=Lautropia dentalis TaxID=2490857 RepID=A0A426FQL4_9BURK|nr:carbohydrate ABC transporter permease [Lautropia dentalis]RRN44941.1 carbohydrate ABC transporter permease [Lautropia dentalis]